MLSTGQMVGDRVGEEGGERLGERLGHLGAGEPVAAAEVHLVQALVDPGREAERRRRGLGGLPGPGQWGAEHGVQVLPCGPGREVRGLPAAEFGERHIRAARVAVVRVPDGLAVAYEDEVGHGAAFPRAWSATAGASQPRRTSASTNSR